MESDYDRKFEEMKKYIPFLESMIRRLENTSTGSINPRQAQLSKIRALRDLLLDRNKRMKMENLLKCEQVLVNLYAKVESRDTLPGIQKAPQSVSSTRQTKSPPHDLETVRRKLKAVQENEETLPEIARANQSEVDCTPGSKEPALFQRRPNKASPPTQITTRNQPSCSRRSYTRVLVSPPPSDRHWTTSEDHITPDNHLFHRRSPKKSPNKKDRKKSSKHDRKSTRSDNNLNITLNVPEESINSLNTEDIFDRIINCDNSDVDIGTLRDLRSQILSELKQTGTNEDISDLILKSYRKKSNKSQRNPDVEEGELSDSESEVIENVYGSLVIADGDKQSGKCKETTASSKDLDICADPRKIQIHLVISNSNKEKRTENPSASEINEKTNPILCDQNKSNFHSKINISSDNFNSSTETKLNTSNDDLIADEAPSVTVSESPKTSYLLDLAEKSPETETVKEKISKNTSNDEIVEKAPTTKQTCVTKIAEPTNNKKTDDKAENKANFYKPIVEPDANKPENMESKGSKDVKTTLAPEEYIEKLVIPTDSKENSHKDKQADLKSEESVQIPFLSEPSNVNPSKESKNVVSEIDILQALKNEILSETIAIPGTEIVTPALHQPKVTKVANAHEIAVKRKISLENYKKKSEQKKPLYIKETPLFGSKKRDDVPQVPSRGLTTKELERFNLAHLALDDSSDEEDQKTKGKENEDNISIDDIYGDLAPRSPDAEILLKIGKESPVIIPEEPVEAPVVESKADVDMRTFIPMVSPQNTKCSPMASNEPAPYKPPKLDTNRSINEPSLPRPCDPRKRKDNFNPSLNNNHSSSLPLFNPGGTPRPMSNFANMTPSRTPNMILSMTPSRMQNMTPNARNFEITPSHSFEVDDQSTKRKHVYAPVMWDTCDKDTTQETSSPRWENNETHNSSTIREGQSKQMSTRWGDRDPRSSCVAKDETCDNRDKYQQRRDPRLNERRDDGYLRSECPPTPSHYFGRGEYPSTPSHTFGRVDGPMTPVHPFGRSDKPPTTPSHPFGSGESPSTPCHQFGRSDMPMTPSHPFGRSDCPSTPSHPFGRTDCPNTPSHPFGRTDCSTTPSHPFGRSDYPTTPSHPFSRSDCPGTPSHPFGRSEGYPQDPRYNRGGKYDHEEDRNYSRDRNALNYNRSNSYGSDKLNRYLGTNEGYLRFGRERSVGRNDPDRYNREHSVGRNDQNHYIYDPSEGRRPNKRDTSVGRTREPSVGRVREPSIGRVRESCFGRISTDYDDLPCSKDNQKGRRSGHESRFDHVPNRSFTEVGTRRERSIGRTMPSKQFFSGSSDRASSVNRTSHEMLADNTVSVKSHAGRSFTIDTSINATFQEFNFADEASRMFHARRERAASVGRSLNRESSLSRSMEPDGDIRHERTFISNKNTSKFSRACSVGRDLAGCRPERSLKEIKADLETFKSNVVLPKRATRGKSVDKSSGREDAIALKKNIADTKTVHCETKKAPIRSSSRDPRSRKEIYDAHKQKPVSTCKKDAYSPRKNIRDPRMRHEKHTTSTKYNVDHRHRNQYDNKFYGIVYTNEAIAKGNILGPGYGVKNYKIPKIKRPPEETTEKQPDLFQSDNEKEKDSKEIKVDTSRDNKKQETDSKSKKQVKDESDVKTKISKSNKADDLQNFSDVSPIRTRRTCKSAIVYSDIDSDSNERTEDKMATENSSPIKTKTLQKYDKKSIAQAKDIESNDNDSLDFTFDIQDEDIDLFNENIASDTVIDNINDLIADLDKDIGTPKSNESMITKLTKDSIIENILESLSSADSTNFVSENIQDESLKKQVLATVGNIDKSKLDAKEEQEQNNMNETEIICKEIIHQTVSEMSDIINERNVDPSAIIEIPNETTQKAILMPLPQASKEDNFQTVSTSIPEENSQNSGEIIEQSPYENSEVCSTPDSTINTEDNISQPKSFHEKPDSTISAQTEMNSDISSTHEHTEVPCNDVTAETSSLGEAVAPKSDSLGSILSLLKDKSKIKELLSMLDDQSDNEKLKKKLEKLSEIVSDDEDSPEKSNIMDKETTDNKVQLDPKPETTPVNPQKDENQSESVINKPEKPMDIEDNVGEMEPSEVDQSNIEKCNKSSKAKEDETNEIEDKTENNDKAKVSSSDDEADNEPIVKRSQSRAGKKIIGKRGKARWPNWAKKINKLKVQANEQKRVTRSETVIPQAKRLKKRKCEVQSLQEDVKDMFMSGGVLNETGIRMCRLAKLVDEKSNIHSNESSPAKTNDSGNRSDADLRDNTETGPVVVLEKFSTKKLEYSLPKPTRKKPGPKPKSKPATEKPVDTKTTEKPKPTQAYKPGPKSKTKVLTSQKCDPYEFKENDSISESTIKTSENTPFNSDSDSESLNSSKSFGSMELLAEKKQRSKKRKSKWQMGVIKSKKTKKNANKTSPRPPVERDPTPEPIVATPIKKFPDMDCFTDKSYCFVKSSSTYACRLCEFEGESIVHHYKKQHPHYEIPLSRMHPRTAFDAIKQSMTTNFQEISKVPVAKYVCRFCMMIFDDKRKAILEEFFWHVVSTHTGEYKQLCSECLNIKKCTFMLDIPPPPKDLKGLLMGYICGKCNYTQVSLENLKNHVSLRHNDEETEVYTISLGVMTQKMVETLKMLAIEESPRTIRNLRSNNSSNIESNIDDKSATEVGTQRKRRLRGPRSVQSKIQFESETVSDESEDTKLDVKREKVAEESKDTQDLVSSLEDPVDDHNINADPEPDKATLETAASNIDNSARTSMESIQNNSSLDVFVESHFKINYTETGNKEYLCCINGHNHYTTSLLISMKKHVQTKHTLDVWDGYCSVCKVIVMSQGIHKFKDCLAHFLDKHPDNFPVLEKTTKEIVTAPAELVRTESPKTYIQVRPISELISNQSQTGSTETQQEDLPIALPKIESVVSLNIDAISNPSVVEQPQENPIADTNNYDEPAVQPKEIIEINYEEAQKEVMSKKHRIVLDMMMSPDKLAHVFKCAGRYCSFTCASTEDALVHASTHQRVGGKDALICSYCSFDAAGNAIDLVSHVFKEHGACQFCCKACFYRAITSTLVEAHYIRMHGVISPGVVLQATIITSFLKRADESEGLLSRQEAVKHYVCCSDAGRCKFKTFTPGKFMEHLSQRHPDVQCHDCNECPYIATSTMDLLQHLQSHGLKLYQCTWCIFGADTENEMLGHASIKHPMKRPQAYLRHIIESKDGTSTAKFKVLPFVHITKKTAIAPVEVPLGAKPDNPVREAERALELEKLIGHTDQMIQNFNSELISSPIQSRVTVLEEEELIDSESIPSASRLEDQATQQIEDILEPPRQVTSTPLDRETPVSERATPQLKIEAVEKTPREENNTATTQNSTVSDVIYCLDSDEEDSNQGARVIDLSDDYDSNIGPPPPVDKTTATDKGATQRFPWLQLFKCSKCNTTFKTGHGLKRHYQCCFPNTFDVVSCPYCTYKTEDKNKIINHYTKQHGQLDRYMCGICKHEETSSKLIRKHFGTVHGLNKLGFKMQNKSSHSIEYLVDALDDTQKTRGRRKRSNNDPPISAPPAKVRRYGPGDVSLLPINQIFDELAQCSLCEFSTKVRQNLIRHLQLHSQQQSVPEIAPINPVPHLETNEMHFDRMLNLASSSISNKTTEKSRPESEPVVAVHIPPEAAARYPIYIPERQRYACGTKDCSYISIDEAMLKCHWETLHSGSNDYHCVHCPETQQVDTSKPLTAARIIGHLKMHDVRLFACSACAYYHYQQHIVDKHLIEKHNGNAQLKVVRGPSAAPPPLVSSQSIANAPTMDLKPWQCGLCKFKSMLRPEVVDHCSKHHQSKFQYKCAFCPWRSSTLENVTKHHSNSHSEQRADVFYFYYREGSISDEPDGTPRWMKQRLKAGLSVEHEVKTETEAPTMSTPITIQPPPGVSVDLNIVKSEIPDPESPKQDQGTIKDLCMKFGNFCDPNGIRYKCSLCKQTMEDTREAMQSHLYEELKYRKWGCSVCSYRAFHKKGLKEHAFHEHRKNLEPVEMSSDKQIETWVTELLDHQENIIKKNLTNFQNQKILTTEKKQLSMSEPKEKETSSMIDKLPAGESSNISKQELTKQLGPFGEPKYLMFCCPKCDDQIKEESKMNEHLEMELSKVRWCCSNCPVKFQNYHQAQLHCRTVHIGQSAKAVEAVRDPKIRSAWIAAVIQAQKLNMNIMPIMSVTSAPNKSAPPAEKEPEQEPAENSLLVVRYEENIPNPETSKPQEIHTRRKRPVFMGDVDSDDEDERLVIDEEPEKKTDTVSGVKCPYCECRTSNRSTLNDHILRHYNLKPYRCAYCDFNAYNQTMYKHIEKKHPGMARNMTKVKVPDTPPIEINITLGRGGPTKRKSKDLDAVFCLYCEATFPESNTHTHPNREPQFAGLGENVLKCNHCVTLRKDLVSMKEHYKFNHPSTSLDISQYVIKEDRESRLLCTTKRCRKSLNSLDELKLHHEADHAGQQLRYRVQTVGGQYEAVPIEGQNKLDTFEIVDLIDDAKSPETSVAKRKSDNPVAGEPKRFAKKSTTKLPFTNAIAKKSTTKLPFYEELSDSDEEEYSYYGTKPPCLDGYANISTLMSSPDDATPLPVTLPALRAIVDIAPKVVVKDIKKTDIEVKI